MGSRGEKCNGPLVRTLRKRKGLTQQALADELGLAKLTILRIEQGINVDLTSIGTVATSLGVATADIIALDGTDAPDGYASWHQTEATFLRSARCKKLRTVSFNEQEFLWSKPDLYVPYEARLSEFCGTRGGEVSRVFVVGRDWADESRRSVLTQTMVRHRLLGFELRVGEKHQLDSILKESGLGLGWDSLAWQDDGEAILVRYSTLGSPRMVRLAGESNCAPVLFLHEHLWTQSRTLDDWFQHQNIARDLRALEKAVAFQIKAVEAERGKLVG